MHDESSRKGEEKRIEIVHIKPCTCTHDCICTSVFVTVSEKTDHLVQVSDIEILVPCCSTLFTLCNGEVRIAIVYTVLE